MDLIVETDCGHDPDDFFTLCYLHSAGVNIRAILITPGDPDQIAIAKFFCEEVGLDIPVGVSKIDQKKLSSGSVHYRLLENYGYKKERKPDDLGLNVLKHTLKKHPESELFVIGPVTSIGKYLKDNPKASFKRATMQGGFLSYNLHDYPCMRDSKFEGKSWMPTFNLNGDRDGGMTFINSNIAHRQFVGKNVCHTVLFTKTQLDQMATPRDRASELFKEGMTYYLEKHDQKKFHDPTAAVCHLHPEIGSWVRGKTKKMESGWGTELDENGDYILADIDYDALWKHILNWN